MIVVTAEQMRMLDQRTIQEAGVPGEVLMERAGAGVARQVKRLLRGTEDARVEMVAGRGNNGGDIFAAAHILAGMGIESKVLLAASEEEVKGDAFVHFERMKDAGVRWASIPGEDEWNRRPFSDASVVVEGLLGTGAKGAPRGVVGAAVKWIHRQSAYSRILAVDVPSGLDADAGEAEGDAVEADVTVSMAFPKMGLVEAKAQHYVGRLEIVDIGIPSAYADEIDPIGDVQFISAGEVAAWLGKRDRRAHKGTFGHVLVIAGSRGSAGAAGMAVGGALRAGAGLVTAWVPRSIQSVVAGANLECMTVPIPETGTGVMKAAELLALKDRLRLYDAVLVGPGMTTDAETAMIVRTLLRESPVPLVLDADAINVCAEQPKILCRGRRSELILTPHPGEMARLMKLDKQEVQSRRKDVIRRAADFAECTVVLKGAGTLVAAYESATWINMTGNPGMATGGSGDVLGGMIAGLAAQGFSPEHAACAGVYLHGAAGDEAAQALSEMSMTATDILAYLPRMVAGLLPR